MSNFVFDNIDSRQFALRVAYIGGESIFSSNTYAKIKIFKDRAGKRVEPYIYATRLDDNFKFVMEIYNRYGHQYASYEVQAIQEWLFGRKKAKYLTILDPDKANESFLCWLTEPSIMKYAGRVVGWRFTVDCALPYAVTDIVENVYDCSNGNTYIDFHNLSNIDAYLYPEMDIQLIGTNTFVLIENQSDNNRIFSITNLTPENKLLIDNLNRDMKAENGDNILENFNLNWIRLAPGHNRLYVNGKCIITFRCRFAKAVSGF